MPRRRSVAPSRAPPSRSMHTAAAPAPPSMAAPATAPPRQPGMFAQMATTAAGVAVGSAVGHTMANAASSLFGGGSSSESAAQPQQQQMQPAAYDQSTGFQQPARNCDVDAKSFTRCLESTNNDMTACQYYLDALKSCQAFVSSQNI
ncbi:hypothetical protein LPJ59_003523 [Coemansia sp. RSA 2399]|nr:hypothetical protein LPJ59_003523 [Coemansia sp. RSA 2399]KAJ1903288.1 hypothetical protein LPJ81_003141 [Coemansia sp. IMI 209127]